MRRLTRRGFVKRSGLAIGAVGVAGLRGDARATGQGGLTPARRGTYQALVGVLAAHNGLRADARTVDGVTDSFARWYRESPRSMRAHVEKVLDDVEDVVPGGLTRAARSRQAAHLRRWRHGPSGGESRAGHRRAVVTAAFALASPPYGETNEIKLRPLSL
jgi:hypothetical protein